MKTTIKIVIGGVVVLYAYGMFSLELNTSGSIVLDDPCKQPSYINNCIVLSTGK